MWPKETEIRRILQEVMGRIPEKAGEVGAAPDGLERATVKWVRGSLSVLEVLLERWAGLTSSRKEDQSGGPVQSCWL